MCLCTELPCTMLGLQLFLLYLSLYGEQNICWRCWGSWFSSPVLQSKRGSHSLNMHKDLREFCSFCSFCAASERLSKKKGKHITSGLFLYWVCTQWRIPVCFSLVSMNFVVQKSSWIWEHKIGIDRGTSRMATTLKTIIYSIDWLLPRLITAMLVAYSILLPISDYRIFLWVPSINATLYWDIRKRKVSTHILWIQI